MDILLGCIFVGTIVAISVGFCLWFDRLLNDEEDNLGKKRECGKKRI
jgi:hypothetical protein